MAIPVLLIASFLSFALVSAAFDPSARFAQSRDREARERFREDRGLNRPVVVQWGDWITDATCTGFWKQDWPEEHCFTLGESIQSGESVAQMMKRGFANTLQLIFWGVAIAAFLSIALGVYSAAKQYSFGDYFFTTLSFVAIALPPFLFGLWAIAFLGVWLKNKFGLSEPFFFFGGLHSPGQSGINLDYFRHLALPVLTLVVQIVASWTRFERSAMLDVLSQDYVRTARAIGVPRWRVLFVHALRNGLIPLVSVMAVDIGLLFGGLIVTEYLFGIPGMGAMFITALYRGDATVLSGWLLIAGSFVIVFNLLADVLYTRLDPRVRLQ